MLKAQILLLLLVGLGLTLGFQNCSQPPPAPAIDKLTLEAQKAEFAYDAALDQIAYMSCNNLPLASQSGFDKSAYFTLRAGSYSGTGGLKLKDAYMDKYLNLKKKTPEKVSQMTVLSAANKDTVPQLAIRKSGDFQSLYAPSGSARDGYDYANVLEALGTPAMTDLLIKNWLEFSGQRIRYVRNGFVTGGRLEASLYFTSSAALAADVRNILSDNFVLGLTYTHRGAASNSLTDARSPAMLVEQGAANPYNPNTQVYGRGYKMLFRQPELNATFDKKHPGQIWASTQRLVLHSVTEVSLGAENGIDPTQFDYQEKRNWTCPDTMRFRIVTREDAKTVGCNMQPDPAVLPLNLQLVRNSLRTEDWYVDLANRCIVSKKSEAGLSCYGNMRYVEYDLTAGATGVATEECIPAPANNTLAAKVCAAFASICTRQ